MSTVTIYHNPACGTSRKVLELIRAAGIQPQVIEYLSEPPTREQLTAMISQAGLTVRQALREKGTLFESLGLANPSLTDDQLLDAMMEHPILVNRPFVLTERGTRLCRPSELVLALLPGTSEATRAASFVAATSADLPQIRNLLADAGLPVADLIEPTPISFWLARDQGSLAGAVGLERFGDKAVLRSLVVRSDHRGKGLGRKLLQHAEQRALGEGVQALYLLTTTAAELFEQHGYKRIPRSSAPEEIQRSEEFRSLCPDSATCMFKKLAQALQDTRQS